MLVVNGGTHGSAALEYTQLHILFILLLTGCVSINAWSEDENTFLL